MNIEEFIFQAFSKFASHAGAFHFKGKAEYSNIIWEDTVNTLPSEQQISEEVERIQNIYIAQEYARKRAAEYPPITDYLDGVVKGDQEQIDKYIADCQAVKDKYPKPVE